MQYLTIALAVTAPVVRHAPKRMLATCRVCKSSFDPKDNSDCACAFHPGRWMGAENAKHFGTHTGPGGVEKGLTFFWDCCSASSYDAPGCCLQRCLTYDDPDPPGHDRAISREAAMRLRGGFRAPRPLGASAPPPRAKRRAAAVCSALSDLEWRKRRAADATAKPDDVEERCVPCELAAKRGTEIERAIGLRDEASSPGDLKLDKLMAVKGLREALQATASQAPADAAEVLMEALGAAYMAGVDPDDPWMRAVANRVATGEAKPPPS